VATINRPQHEQHRQGGDQDQAAQQPRVFRRRGLRRGNAAEARRRKADRGNASQRETEYFLILDQHQRGQRRGGKCHGGDQGPDRYRFMGWR